MPRNGPLTVRILDAHGKPLKEFSGGSDGSCYVIAQLGQPFSVAFDVAASVDSSARPLLVSCEVDGRTNIHQYSVTHANGCRDSTFTGFSANDNYSSLYQFCFARPAPAPVAAASGSTAASGKVGTVKVTAQFARVNSAYVPAPLPGSLKPKPADLSVQEDKKFWLNSAAVSAGRIIAGPTCQGGPTYTATGTLAAVSVQYATVDALLLMHVLSYDNPEHVPYLPVRAPPRPPGGPREIIIIDDEEESTARTALRKRVKREGEEEIAVCDLTPDRRTAKWSTVKKPRVSPEEGEAMTVDGEGLSGFSCTTPS
eukprot:gnl/Hemi2/9993_TR3461_c0_g1_i1.p1 gnl/Hemi2/9993_TR3461_c0_g1~~gnl/Hemi2/9993_TR3461_c0_g1_i1.p1  ORF type:complete len:322 (-),score=72.89 gnl/Hemi2/9993_TR3461_c0_g1_i1:274-1209(-)